MPPVSVLIKPASGMCNLNCDYCFYCDETARREQASFGFMTEETLKNVIRKTLLNADTAIHYMFQGGEPTLAGIPFFEKVLDYQIQYNKKNIPIYNAIQTNGTLLDEKWCRFLHEHHFLVGLSVDGTKKSTTPCATTGWAAPPSKRCAPPPALWTSSAWITIF